MAVESSETISTSPRLKDVAEAAGVSISTASRVLSGARGASREAAAAVLAASERLNYRPDPIARALRAQTTGLVGMVVPSIGNPFFAEVVEAVENALQKRGLEMIVADSGGDTAHEARRLTLLAQRKVDGLLVVPTHRAESAPALRRMREVPVVLVDRQVDGISGDYVGVDNAIGITLVLDHLEQQGYRSLVFVSDTATSSTGRSRLETFELLVSRRPAFRARPPRLGSFSVEFGRDVVRALLAEGELPDAVVCGSDIIALGVVRELHRAGIDVPHDIGVTGFDGISFAELCDPPLTTIRQPLPAIAEEAVRLLAARMAHSAVAAHRSEVAPLLEIRASSLRQQNVNR